MSMTNLTKDEILLKTIKDRIKWDIRVGNSDVLLKVEDGVVHLYGYFDKSYRHAAAKSIVGSTEGVHGFVDHSKVLLSYYRSDRELEGLIMRQITGMAFLPGEWIDAEVCDGVVKIEGVVYRPRLKAFAARSSWALSGVKDCLNLIEITEPPQILRSLQSTKKSEVFAALNAS
jgi:hyperosmotically inducible protein